MEVCVDSVESAIAAEKGGATRLELCCNLFEGGTTPSLGLLQVVKASCNLPVFVLIRPRGGDFLYSDHEVKVMRHDIQICKAYDADGFVLGALTSEGDVDEDLCREFMGYQQPYRGVKDSKNNIIIVMEETFDMCREPLVAMETIIQLGFNRILTSGQESSVLEGAPLIRQLTEKAHDRIIVMPGGGITERNLARILKETKAQEFHCSARSPQSSQMLYKKSSVFMGGTLRLPEFTTKYADTDMVQRMKEVSERR